MNKNWELSLRTVCVVAAITLAATALPVLAFAHDDNGNGNAYGKNKNYPYGTDQSSSRPYSIGLWGDLPYSQSQADAIPAIIEDMNSQNLAFTVHDGDLRQGSGVPSCADNSSNGAGGIVDLGNIYQRGLAYFNALTAPAIFTTGDNDWTDCDRASLGSEARNSLRMLDYERSLFFSTPYTLGQTHFLQEVQSTPTCKGFLTGTDGPQADKTASETFTYTNVPCVENRRWIVGKVMYAVLDIQGSCDNLCDDYPDPVEHAARMAADIAWMQSTFQTAIDQGAVAVMFLSQADPGWDDTDGTRAPTRNAQTLIEDDASKATDGYGDFLRALRSQVIAFGKPVAYVNGDSHYFRVDKPLLDTKGNRIVNFTRVETFGDHQPALGDVNWLKVNVDPSSREVFSYETQIVNRDILVP
ncbi:MAG TPA: hypothetical protein VGI45_04935 [Terracidiphilus sp.]